MNARLLRASVVVGQQMYGAQHAFPLVEDDAVIADILWSRAKADVARVLLDLPAVDEELRAGEELEIRVQVIEQSPLVHWDV